MPAEVRDLGARVDGSRIFVGAGCLLLSVGAWSAYRFFFYTRFGLTVACAP